MKENVPDEFVHENSKGNVGFVVEEGKQDVVAIS